MITKIKIFLFGEMRFLQNTSASVLDVFTKTVNSLNSINDKINSSIQRKEQTIEALEDQVITLDRLKTNNETTINKLNQILKD